MNSLDQESFLNTLKELSLQPCVTGREVASGMIDLLIGLLGRMGADTVRVDSDGNVVATVGTGAYTIALEAHLDEVGFEVAEVVDDVAVLSLLGSIPAQAIDGAKAYVLRTGGEGVLSASSEADVSFNLSVSDGDVVHGDVIAFKRSFDTERGGVRATALDNRVGCAVLLEVLHKYKEAALQDKRLVFVFSIKEETGESVVREVVQEYAPDLFVVVDAAYAQPVDFEMSPGDKIPLLGSGCALQDKGDGFIVEDPRVRWLERLASKEGIRAQRESVSGNKGRTNFSRFVASGARAGVVVNVPVRNQHGEVSEANLGDAHQAVLLILAMLNSSPSCP